MRPARVAQIVEAHRGQAERSRISRKHPTRCWSEEAALGLRTEDPGARPGVRPHCVDSLKNPEDRAHNLIRCRGRFRLGLKAMRCRGRESVPSCRLELGLRPVLADSFLRWRRSGENQVPPETVLGTFPGHGVAVGATTLTGNPTRTPFKYLTVDG